MCLDGVPVLCVRPRVCKGGVTQKGGARSRGTAADQIGWKQTVVGFECWSNGHWEPLQILNLIKIVLALLIPLQL